MARTWLFCAVMYGAILVRDRVDGLRGDRRETQKSAPAAPAAAQA